MQIYGRADVNKDMSIYIHPSGLFKFWGKKGISDEFSFFKYYFVGLNGDSLGILRVHFSPQLDSCEEGLRLMFLIVLVHLKEMCRQI